MAVPSVFVSSVVRGFEEVREAAAQAVRDMGMHPVLSEDMPADPSSPRRALLDEVAKADYYLLLLGPRYGAATAGEKSPTEDEYDQASARGQPIVVLVQDADPEPRQQEFLERIRGSWPAGILYDSFQGAGDVGTKVAAALGRAQAGVVEESPAAQERALELARGEEARGSTESGVSARVAFAPLRQTILLDALALENEALGNSLAADLRQAGVVPQRIGVAASVSSKGVRLEGSDMESWTRPLAVVERDGSVVVTSSVAAEGDPFGTSIVDPERLTDFVRAAGQFGQRAWDRIDRQAQVARVAVAIAIPDASYTGFGRSSSSSMSVSMQLPPTVVAPDTPLVVPRGQVTDQSVVAQLVAEVKRVFADAGAVQE